MIKNNKIINEACKCAATKTQNELEQMFPYDRMRMKSGVFYRIIEMQNFENYHNGYLLLNECRDNELLIEAFNNIAEITLCCDGILWGNKYTIIGFDTMDNHPKEQTFNYCEEIIFAIFEEWDRLLELKWN